MKDSTKDKFEGTAQEIKGKVKEKVGQLTDDPDVEAEGTGEKIAGKGRRRLVTLRRSLSSSRIRRGAFRRRAPILYFGAVPLSGSLLLFYAATENP